MSRLDEDAISQLKALPAKEGRLFDRLVSIYKAESPKLVDNIDQAIRDVDYENLALSSHSLKSSSAQMGAIELSEICLKLETQGRNQDLQNCQELLHALQDEISDVMNLLDAEVNSG